MFDFTHFDKDGNAIMVDISQKPQTERIAIAAGTITMSKKCYTAVKEGNIKKGDVLGAARIAGIMALKQTATIIPLCHVLPIEQATIDFELNDVECVITAKCTTKLTGKTGVEMEAMVGTSVALLTIYDMCKAIEKNMVIGNITLIEKHGGKSGSYIAK